MHSYRGMLRYVTTYGLWVAAAALALAACDDGDGSPGEGDPADPSPPAGAQGDAPDDWPGGTAGDWEQGDGVEESWHRDSDNADGADPRSEAEAGGPTSGAGGGGGSAAYGSDDEMAGPPAEAARDGDGMADSDMGAPQNGGGLEGGEIDDNDDFAAFIEYAEAALDQFSEGTDALMVRWLDVTRRHIITVRDSEGRTVPDATVLVLHDDIIVTWGRTRADGRFAFFPRAYGDDSSGFDIAVEVGDLTATAILGEQDETLTVRLDGERPGHPVFQVDVAFIIDATGSMGEEIDRIKATVTEIAGQVAESGFEPDVRWALVDYRDFGDDYVTHTVNFTDDVQAYHHAINALRAGGGGDGPEALNEALHEAMRRLEWRADATLRLAFVVADAPAHYYEQAPYTYDHAMIDATTMGVKIFPIASGGSDGVAELQFRQLAQFTLAHFIFITEGGGSSRGSGGSDYEVDPQDFVVEQLDTLVVRLITEEMVAWFADAEAPL